MASLALAIARFFALDDIAHLVILVIVTLPRAFVSALELAFAILLASALGEVFRYQLGLRDINAMDVATVFCTTDRQRSIGEVVILICDTVDVFPAVIASLRPRQHVNIAHHNHALFGA